MSERKVFPLERVINERMTIKQGHRGFGCAVSLAPRANEVVPICIIAGTAEDAAAVCELLTGCDMDLDLVKPVVMGLDPQA
jgi:hypothetical protein